MARVADYVIIRDAWKVDDGSTNPIKFSVPDNIHTGSRCVLNFMFKVDTSGDPILWRGRRARLSPGLHVVGELGPRPLSSQTRTVARVDPAQQGRAGRWRKS